MKPVLLTDFGSTYTKLTAVDLDAAKLLGTAQAYTTVASDVRIGFQKALDALLAQTGPLTFAQSYACSSAAGGLRMMVSGLVPELTMEAARLASLGAGAKIVGQFSFELTQDDLETIQRVNPDIFLLVGGTDGGNSACVIHNAQMLAAIRPQFPIVLAGNRTAMQQCRKALEGFEVSVCENVMPKFGVLKTEDTQKTIRSIFLRRIVQAKGLNAAAERMSGGHAGHDAAGEGNGQNARHRGADRCGCRRRDDGHLFHCRGDAPADEPGLQGSAGAVCQADG